MQIVRIEIAENLHRAELTVLERSEHLAEWVWLTEEKRREKCDIVSHLPASKPGTLSLAEAPERKEVSAQVGPKLAFATNSNGTGRPESGVNAASRDLGVTRQQAQRAIRVAAIALGAKAAAAEAELSDNQSALLAIAAEPTTEAQMAKVREIDAFVPPYPRGTGDGGRG